METNSKIIHLVYCPFSGVGLIGYRGDVWFAERIEIFKRYTLQSLLKQTNRNFVLWLSFRPEEENNYLTQKLSEYLKEVEMPYIFTFHGLMYWDDKFNNDIKSKIMNAGRIVRRCWRSGAWSELILSIKELLIDKNSTLYQRIAKSINIFPRHWLFSELVYLTRIDSDDMFHHGAVEIIQSTYPETSALTCGKGLVYNTTTEEVAEWNPPTNPPFHTIIFKTEVFFDIERHLEHYKDFKSHEDVPRIFGSTLLPDYMYCVTTHNPKNQISTVWNHPFRGIIVDTDLIHNFI